MLNNFVSAVTTDYCLVRSGCRSFRIDEAANRSCVGGSLANTQRWAKRVVDNKSARAFAHDCYTVSYPAMEHFRVRNPFPDKCAFDRTYLTFASTHLRVSSSLCYDEKLVSSAWNALFRKGAKYWNSSKSWREVGRYGSCFPYVQVSLQFDQAQLKRLRVHSSMTSQVHQMFIAVEIVPILCLWNHFGSSWTLTRIRTWAFFCTAPGWIA